MTGKWNEGKRRVEKREIQVGERRDGTIHICISIYLYLYVWTYMCIYYVYKIKKNLQVTLIK